MSDKKNDGFTPVDIGSLDNFDAEIIQRSDKTDPDYDRFTLLFDPVQFETGKSEGFKALYSVEDKKQEDPFKPLFAVKQKPGKVQESATAGETRKNRQNKGSGSHERDSEQVISTSLEDTAAEKGFARGYEEGVEKGRSEGYEKGFEKGRKEGLAKGQEEGFTKGETDGFAKGESEGFKKGEKAAGKEAADALNTLGQALSAVDTALDDVVDAHEQQLLELVFKIAQKAVHASLDTKDDIVRLSVLDALKTLSQPQEIELGVNPEDYEYIEMVKDGFFEAVASLHHVAVKSDPMVRRGGCRIETDTASVATDPEAKLHAVYEAVKNAGRS
ncbi:MAG: FliH/SctL family protein [Desulfotignum sp.]